MLRFPELERFGVLAAVSGTAEGDCASADDGESSPGREAFFAACGVPASRVVCARQVHGVRVARAGASDGGRGAHERATAIPDTDGLITDEPGLALGISVADCVPVYLVDPVRPAAGLLHAGRQGTFANIAGAGVRAMRDAFDSAPGNLHAVIGPSAGPARYEVSREIAEAWRAAGLPSEGRLLDLWEANAMQLARAGVPRCQVHVAGICTINDTRFHSHRRDADGRRNLALLALEDGT
jgi:hypothetical protein